MKKREEEILRLVTSFSKGELSEEEFTSLKELLEKDESNKAYFKKYLKFFNKTRGVGCWEQLDSEKAWASVSSEINKPALKVSSTNRFMRVFAYAASVIILMAVVGYFYNSNILNYRSMAKIDSIKPGSTKAVLTLSDGSVVDLEKNMSGLISDQGGTEVLKDSSDNLVYKGKRHLDELSQEPIYNTIRVPKGGEYSLKLSDGTKVWLNSETVLRFPVDFVGKTRRVYVKGEAFFDVEHNKQKPFIVEANGSTVKVLGTRFNVSAYSNNDAVVTTLVEGKVRVGNKNDKADIEPGQQSIVYKEGKKIDIREVDVSVYTAWISGVFEFEDMSLEYIVDQLERWYEVEFVFADESLKDVRFTGAAGKDKRLTYVLEMIEELSKVKFVLKGETIIIRK